MMGDCTSMHTAWSDVESENRWKGGEFIHNKWLANKSHLTPKRRNYLMNNPLWINYANFLMCWLQKSIKRKELMSLRGYIKDVTFYFCTFQQSISMKNLWIATFPDRTLIYIYVIHFNLGYTYLKWLKSEV